MGLYERGVNLHCEYLGNLRSISNLFNVRGYLRRMVPDFDIVHAQYGSACAWATTAMTGIPKVLSIRGNDWDVYSSSIGFHFFHTRLARAMTKWSLEHFDCVITRSNRMAKAISRFAPRLHVISVPSPIDLNRFVPQNKLEARYLLGFPKCTEKWVLFNAVNLNDPVKRFSLAKETFELANAKLDNLRFRIATNLPHDMMPLYTAACDVIICTSETEGWPNCVKEALACNVPFVSTNVSDLQDIAKQEPTCRVCPADPVVLADNICEVLALQQQPNLRMHVASMDLGTVSNRLVGIYESLLSQDRSKNVI